VEIHVDREPKMTMRYSTKTGQSHGVGGFTGEAIYEGPASIAQFLPMFQAARYCGIGRHTVWGNGMIEASLLQRADSIEHHQRESRE
jgi:CRISPR/Cas system endoribonuclease Cas6 (RAMP superfamily)